MLPRGAQCSGLALKDRQVMPPVVNSAWWELMTALDHPHMLTQDLSFGGVTPEACFQHDHQPVWIDAQTDRAVRK